MKNSLVKIICLSFILYLFIGINHSYSQIIKGNGNVITQERSVSAFRSIVATGSFELFLVKGDKQNVQIVADENLHNLFISNVRNETLDLQIVGEVKRAKELKVYVTFVNLHNLIAIGAVDVRTDTTIQTNSLDIFVSGVSSVKINLNTENLIFEITDGAYAYLQGNTENFDIRITDEAELNAFNLAAKKCNVKISGYSDAKISVEEELKLRVTGAGNLYYKGNPKITDRIFAGSGFIIRRKND